MEGRSPSGDKPVKARIYRDFDALRDYQLKSVAQAQGELEKQ